MSVSRSGGKSVIYDFYNVSFGKKSPVNFAQWNNFFISQKQTFLLGDNTPESISEEFIIWSRSWRDKANKQ